MHRPGQIFYIEHSPFADQDLQTGSDQQRSDAVQAHQSLSKLMEDQLRAAQQQIDAANAMGKEVSLTRLVPHDCLTKLRQGFPAIEDAFTKSAEHLKAR